MRRTVSAIARRISSSAHATTSSAHNSSPSLTDCSAQSSSSYLLDRVMFMNLNNLQNRSKRVTLLHSKRQFASGFLQRQEVSERVKQVVKNFAKVNQGKVSDQAKFAQDLGLDSLDTVEVVMAIEEEFAIEIPDVEADKIVSIDLAVDYIASVPEAK